MVGNRVMKFLCSLLFLGVLFLSACENKENLPVPSVQATAKSVALVFDPAALDMGDILEGDKATASILIRNDGDGFAQIASVTSACGCTTAEPETRLLAAGAFTPLHIVVDTFGKRGDIRKSITMTDGLGNESTAWITLHVKSNPHAMGEGRSIFDGKCASCHFDPAKGQTTGIAIYNAVCVMCHGVNAQGAYAPALVGHHELDILSTLIANGTGTHHMPAFSQDKAGPLSPQQIKSLAKWIISLDE